MFNNAVKKVVSWASAAMLLLVLFVPATAQAVEIPDCAAFMVAQAQSGIPIMEEASETRGDVAGLARLPALLLVCEAVDAGTLQLNQQINVSAEAAGTGGPSAFLSAGESIAVGEALNGAVIILAGDAILALCEAISPSRQVFTEKINQRLMELGVDATYSDILGTDAALSAAELVLVGAALLRSRTFCDYGARYYYELQHENGSVTVLASSNKLIKQYPGTTGVATGSSAEAGYCGLFSVKGKDADLICCVLGAKNASERCATAMQLLDYAYSAYDIKMAVRAGSVVEAAVPVSKGKAHVVNVIAVNDVLLVLDKGQAYERVLSMETPLAAPLFKGDAVGELSFLSGTRVLGTTKLAAGEDVPRAGWGDYVQSVFVQWLHR